SESSQHQEQQHGTHLFRHDRKPLQLRSGSGGRGRPHAALRDRVRSLLDRSCRPARAERAEGGLFAFPKRRLDQQRVAGGPYTTPAAAPEPTTATPPPPLPTPPPPGPAVPTPPPSPPAAGGASCYSFPDARTPLAIPPPNPRSRARSVMSIRVALHHRTHY